MRRLAYQPLKDIEFYSSGLNPLVSVEDLARRVGKADLPCVYIKLEFLDNNMIQVTHEEGAIEYLRLAKCAPLMIDNMRAAFYKIRKVYINYGIRERLDKMDEQTLQEIGVLQKMSIQAREKYDHDIYKLEYIPPVWSPGEEN